MKKLFFVAAMTLSLGTAAFATTVDTNDMMTVQVMDDFVPVKLEEVPQAVVDAVTKAYPEQTLKEAAVRQEEESETQIYKLTLVAENGTETSVLFTDKGEEVK